ncbi:MAG: DNA gyrase subunit A [Candidatus Pacebacteria bacterium]|nr:DNA gyrase subunit A [Candidatus Paceibacterota bacterium]
MESNIAQHDIPASIEDIMHEAYLQYSLSVNVGRAIPDVRDGFKPVHRRILYAMRQLGLTKSHAYTKCAKVVGEVIGNYHPHGDQAAYDTLVRLAQEFSMRHPLVDGQGNFGSIDGDSPAAYRYTECRLERLAEEMLADMDRDTVDMRLTFDEENEEPEVLPAGFPNLLVNGSTGIGVGMATSIPPHNLGEIIAATVALIDNPLASVRELMQHVRGPDFPTGASIMGFNPIIDLYETGHGVIKMRGKAVIEENQEDRERIIISEIPYAVNKTRLITEIANCVQDKRIPGVSGLNDESSSRVGIRIVVDVKRNAMGTVVLNQLYKHTSLETTMGCQFLVIDHNQPRTMNLRQVLQAYIDHRLEVITRRARFDLGKAEDRAHVLAGLLTAVQNIDEVVRIIRESRTREEAGATLSERFDLSDRQTAAILDMRLHQLTGLATDQLQEEFDALQEKIAYLKQLLSDRQMRMQVIKDELLEIKRKYADDRRTTLLPSEKELNIEDLIARDICAVTISAAGYIKRVPADTYRTQNRGGVGIIGMQTKEEDHVEHLVTACTHDYILFFTSRGQMHWLKVYEIPEGARVGRGKALVNLVELAQDEYVRAIITVPELDVDDQYVIMATANGIVKKTALNKFRHLRRRGIRAIVLDDGDDLIDARLTDGKQEVLLSSEHGMAVRFHEGDCRPMGRVSRGVRGMELRDKNGTLSSGVVSMTIVDPEADLLVVTAKGMGKRTRLGTGHADQDKDIIGGYRLTRRGSKGVISIRLDDKDRVVAALLVEEGNELLMTSVNGQMVRIGTDDIRAIGRNSKGVRIMRLREKDQVGSVTKVLKLEEEEECMETDGESPAAGGEGNAQSDAPPPPSENGAVSDSAETSGPDTSPEDNE